MVWGTQTAHDGKMQGTTVDYLKNNEVYAIVVREDNEALEIFNKIKLEAKILNQLTTKLEYKLFTKNCNTSTNYFAQQYLGGQDVFSKLPYGKYEIYTGYSDPFYDPNSTSETDRTIREVREALDKFYSIKASDFDIATAECGTVIRNDGWYIKIWDKNKGYYLKGEGNGIIACDNSEDIVFAKEGNNIVDLGGGSDTYYGGEGNDIVDGGSGVDSSNDTNTINRQT